MNPFKRKTLEEFTISDCEAYLESYPYGDYAYEVKKRLKGLKKGVIKVINIEKAAHQSIGTTRNQNSGKIEQKCKKIDNRITQKKNTQKNNIHSSSNISSKPNASEKMSVGDVILWWIGVIVIVLIVGSIIVYILYLILPEGASQFISKYRWGIYVLGLYISKYFK